MYNLLSLLVGIIIACMLAVNGKLANWYGVFTATVMIHIVGSVVAFVIIKIGKGNIKLKKEIPFWMYLAGAIGVLTTVFNNLAFGRISLTSMVALALLGETVMAVIVDVFGLFGMEKYPFKKSVLIGLIFAMVGIFIMMDRTTLNSWWAVLISFLSGAIVVCTRTINAKLSDEIGSLQGSFVNHFAGFLFAFMIIFIFGRNEMIFSKIIVNTNPMIYLGGALGAVVVFIYNITVSKVPAFRLTLLTFVAQIFTSVMIDILTNQSYTMASFLGGIMISAGVGVNMLIEQIGVKRVAESK